LPFNIDGGIISIVIVLQAGRTGVHFLAGAAAFSLLQNIQNSPTAHSPSNSMDTGILCLGVQQLGHEVDHLPPGTGKLKNEVDHLLPGTGKLKNEVDHLPPGTGKLKNDWSCTSTLLMAWTEITLLFPLLRNDYHV
jgi:hypothetical protein